jgi:N utilization substance protein B
MEHLEELDGILNEYSRGWKTSRMNRVDLTALRLAVYEMKFEPDVPVGVSINEAVEIAKNFGGEDSSSFVNGVLGKIASGKKDDEEAYKPKQRQTHKAKIIIRSSKKTDE